MPTVMRIGPYRLFFYSADGSEPIHIHVQRDRGIAKFWLEPVRLADTGGFANTEINAIERIFGAWHDYFNN